MSIQRPSTSVASVDLPEPPNNMSDKGVKVSDKWLQTPLEASQSVREQRGNEH